MPEWRDMFGKELKVGYWVAIPGRNGEKGTRFLAAGWYQIEDLRQDDERDWIIRFDGDRYQWLFSWDTLPASDQPGVPRYERELTVRPRAADVLPRDWLYLPARVNGWFQVARLPTLREDEVVIPLVGRRPAVFHRYSRVSVRNWNPDSRSESCHG